jgi:hypothetical protein
MELGSLVSASGQKAPWAGPSWPDMPVAKWA